MKKHILYFLLAIAFLPFLSSAQTVHLIQVANYQFTPNSLTGVKIGDTIEWVWVSGVHTASSVSVPNGAASFDFSISSGKAKYVIKVAGTYDYQCNFHGAGGMTGSFVVDAATSVSSINFNELILEPNPAHDFVNIKMSSNTNDHAKITVFDLIGRSVLSNEMELYSNDRTYTMDISGLKNGMYLVYVSSGASISKAFRMIKR
jgi:plastocyanin